MNSQADHSEIIRQTTAWIQEVVIGLNFCPFAAREVLRDSLHYQIVQKNMEETAAAFVLELMRLNDTSIIETTLLIFPGSPFDDFLSFLSFIELAEEILTETGHEGIYQLAHFHPDYQFADTSPNDLSNYTNRSPYPILQILRADSIEKALTNYAHPEEIPLRNMETARKMGLEAWQRLLAGCGLWVTQYASCCELFGF